MPTFSKSVLSPSPILTLTPQLDLELETRLVREKGFWAQADASQVRSRVSDL
jgi:hypothetical protein